MKRPKAPRVYPPIDPLPCPPCKHACDELWHCVDPQACVRVAPLVSDLIVAWAMVAICAVLAVLLLIGWI